MSFFHWLRAKNPAHGTDGGAASRPRRSFSQTTLPLMSPRRGRRILRREQLFSVVRESLIRAGVLSTSYEFKVLALDANGDAFLVLIDLALPAETMPDEYLLEIERWIQGSAGKRHSMSVPAVYWRRKAVHDQRGIALRAAVAAQTKREATPNNPLAFPAPNMARSTERVQAVSSDEVDAFRRALQSPAIPPRPVDLSNDEGHDHPPESHSDFSALSATQYGKL